MTLNLALLSFQHLQEASVIRRVSTTSAGAQVGLYSSRASVSAEGQYVLFESGASDLVAGDTNSRFDVFLKNLKTGGLTLVSRASDGTLATGGESFNAQFSGDGRSIIFESRASNLVVGDTNSVKDVFRKDISTGIIHRLTMGFDGVQTAGDSSVPSVTPDGRYMVFSSFASNLVPNDTNTRKDIFLRDLVTGAITRVSVARDGIEANFESDNATLSADSRYVVFQSNASNLVGGDTNGTTDIFYKDLITQAIVRLSLSVSSAEANASSLNPQLSANGRYVVFESAASNLVAGDTNGASDIFRKDLVTGEIVRISTGSDGAQGTGGSSNASISADGRYVLFESQAHDLVGGEPSAFSDIYRKDMLTGGIIRISSLGTSPSDGNSSKAKFSPDGRYIVFETAASGIFATDSNGSMNDIIWVDASRIADGVAIREGRFVELNFGANPASTVTMAWGDGTVDVVHPASSMASFSHSFAATGTKTVVATVQEGGQSRSISYIVNLAAGTMTQSSAPDTIAGGGGADRIVGDGFANHLIGHGGNDVLDGQGGADYMAGGAGDDVYMVEHASDIAAEAAAEGIDLVYSSINYTLGAHVENITATGASALVLSGNDLGNAMIGNASRNTLYGGGGDDILAGGDDNDIILGGTGKDVFVFNTTGHKSRNKDLIQDWNYREDTIRLDNDIFKKLTKVGVLQGKYFTIGSKAKDADDFIGVDKKTGNVWYDPNGNKAGGQVIFANIGKKKAIFASDFEVF